MKIIDLNEENRSLYTSYFTDESRLSGQASRIVFPDDVSSLCAFVKESYAQGVPLVVQGARTGLCGGAVPKDPASCVIALENLTDHGEIQKDGQSALIEVQCGLSLGELHKYIARSGYRFAPDPSEDSATVGGLFANQAKGMNAATAGTVSRYVEGLSFLLYDGTLLHIARGECTVTETGFTLPDGKTFESPFVPSDPRFPFLPHTGEDLIDLLAGSEGAYGIAVDFTLRLLPADSSVWGIWFFFPDGEDVFRCAELIRGFAGETPRVRSLDFLSGSALHTADSARSVLESLNGIPDLPDGSESALYLELAGTSDEALEETLMLLADELELHGFDLDNTWVATDLQGVERFHAFRHAVPEQLNARLDTLRQKESALHRASVDLACEPASCAAHMEALVNRTNDLPVSAAVYGHVLDGRIHVDLLPETKEDLPHCEAFFRGLSMNPFLRAGAENGIGKLKRELLRLSLTEEEYKLFCAVKGFFDPQGLWNPGSFIPD